MRRCGPPEPTTRAPKRPYPDSANHPGTVQGVDDGHQNRHLVCRRPITNTQIYTNQRTPATPQPPYTLRGNNMSRYNNIARLRRIAREKGLAVAVTNSRRHGKIISIRVYASEADKGHPDRALFDFGTYANERDVEAVRAYVAA